MNVYKVLIYTILFCFGFARKLDSSIHPLSDRFIELTNQEAKTWTAGRNFPVGTSMMDLKIRLGAMSLPEKNMTTRFVHVIPEAFEDIENFDAREEWPHCSSLNEIRNQGNCGSCWAVSSAAVMTDRSCIHSGGETNVHYSSQHILSCCGASCGHGCHGGYVDKAFNFWVLWGVVTGGPYNSFSGCMPYQITDNSTYGKTPACTNTCRAGYEIPFNEDHHYGRNIVTFNKQEKDTKYEIIKNGPVTAIFRVHDDFYNYKSGVYQHVIGDYSGRHAIKIIGFGVTEDNVKYWLCANSWSSDWGDKGYFKILRGKNECKIEEDILTGTPFFNRN